MVPPHRTRNARFWSVSVRGSMERTPYNRAVITAEEAHVIRVLSLAGIRAEKIPESTSRTPDLRAQDPEHRYLVEVKTRTDDETLTRDLRETGYAQRATP